MDTTALASGAQNNIASQEVEYGINQKETDMNGIVERISGNNVMQRFYRKLYRLSLNGMNYGNSNIEHSGELQVLKYIRRNLKQNGRFVIFDVGGNVGNYSKALAAFFGEQAYIHAFEPSEKTYQQFIKNTATLKDIKANNVGLSDKAEILPLYTNPQFSGLSSLYHRNLAHHGIAVNKSESIRLTTLDQYCERNFIDRINFLKLDTEGHELKVLKGASNMLEKERIDFIQFEFGGCNIDSRTFFQDFFYLLNSRYKIYRILPYGMSEVKAYDESQEIFMTINFLAERRKLKQQKEVLQA